LITRRCGDRDAVAVQRNDRHDRLAGCALLDGIDRAFAPTLRGADRISGRDQRGQTRNGKMRGPQPCLLALSFCPAWSMSVPSQSADIPPFTRSPHRRERAQTAA
jgi:hypothetical protein